MATAPTGKPAPFPRDRGVVRAELLDTAGNLDLPAGVPSRGPVHVAAHNVPLADGPHDPHTVVARLCDGELSVGEIVEAVVDSTAAAVERYDDVVIDDLFSVLPQLGIREEEVPLRLIERLADVAAAGHARIQATTRWNCPSARTLQPFVDRGVPVLVTP